MEVRQYRQLFKNLLNDVANSVIVVALLIYPIVWVLNISSDIQQEVNFKLYVNYVLIAFFGKQLGRLFILLWSRRSKKNKDGSEKAWWQCTVRLTNVYKTGNVVSYFHNISQIYKHHEKDFTICPAVFVQLCCCGSGGERQREIPLCLWRILHQYGVIWTSHIYRHRADYDEHKATRTQLFRKTVR